MKTFSIPLIELLDLSKEEFVEKLHKAFIDSGLDVNLSTKCCYDSEKDEVVFTQNDEENINESFKNTM